MSSATRIDASFFSGVSLPTIFVLTGPAAGKVSIIVSDWNLTALSIKSGWKTPHAPGHGSVLSSYRMPRILSPLTYVSSQSLRLERSCSYCPMSSEARLCNSLSFIKSARLASKSSARGRDFSNSTTTPSIPIRTSSGSTISISIGSISAAIAAMPWGASIKLLSTAI